MLAGNTQSGNGLPVPDPVFSAAYPALNKRRVTVAAVIKIGGYRT